MLLSLTTFIVLNCDIAEWVDFLLTCVYAYGVKISTSEKPIL